MTVAELIGKIRTKRQAAERSAFGHYLEAVKALASGKEIDADEVGHMIEAAGRDESQLEKDVSLQQERNGRYAQLTANRQAAADRIAAERDLRDAQASLQKAINELTPAVDAAASRLRLLDQAVIQTSYAEAWLAEHVLDVELLQRESAVSERLKEVNTELRPLLTDREHKQHSLENAEFNLAQIRSRDSRNALIAGIENFINQPLDLRQTSERIADLKNQLAQLEEAIRPRQAEQQRLQAELQKIHAEKLKP